MKHSDSITSVQLAVIVISTMIGVSMLALPRFVIARAGVAAPLASLIGISISLIGIIALLYLGKRFPGQTFIGFNTIILGKAIGNFMNAFLLLLALVLFGLEIRQFSEVLIGGLLPNTPIGVSILAMIILCAVINFSNVSTFAYIHFFYLPFIILPLFLVLLPSFKDVEYYHLLPIYGHNISLKDFMSGALSMIAAISNYFIIGFVFPYLKDQKNIIKSGVWGFLIGAFIVFFLIVISLGVFGEFKITDIFWSTLILARMVEVPGEILARIDAIFIISWIFAVFTTLLSYYFIFVIGFAEMFRSVRFRAISAVGTPIAFIIAIIPENIYQLYRYINLIWSTGVVFFIFYLLFLILVAKIRRKKGKEV